MYGKYGNRIGIKMQILLNKFMNKIMKLSIDIYNI